MHDRCRHPVTRKHIASQTRRNKTKRTSADEKRVEQDPTRRGRKKKQYYDQQRTSTNILAKQRSCRLCLLCTALKAARTFFFALPNSGLVPWHEIRWPSPRNLVYVMDDLPGEKNRRCVGTNKRKRSYVLDSVDRDATERKEKKNPNTKMARDRLETKERRVTIK